MPALTVIAALLLAGCELRHPEVVIVNNTAESIVIRDPSFSGCRWNQVLARGQATAPQRCLPGTDHVHFETYDVREQLVGGSATRDGERSQHDGGVDAEPSLAPMWFPYQSISVKRVGYDEFHRFEIVLQDMEQDFAVPGPYGH